MAKGILTATVAHTVVRHAGRFLLVKERKHGLWFLPGGRVEEGEGLLDAALRETREETGVPVQLEALLRLEHTPTAYGARLRVFFLARPVDIDLPLRPDGREILEARWFEVHEISALALRGSEAGELLQQAQLSVPRFPLDLVAATGVRLAGAYNS